MNRFNLPEIELDSFDYERRSKYLRLYLSIIDKCLNIKDIDLENIYTETHHILPKCMGGTNEKSNLIKMPIRYHVMAHLVIAEVYPEIFGLQMAVLFMIAPETKKSNIVIKNRNIEITKTFSSRRISEAREKAISRLKGKKLPKEVTLKISKSLTGRKLTEEHKANIRKGTKKGIESPHYGKKVSQHTKELISKNHAPCSGSNNARARKVQGPDGTIYSCAKEAAKYSGVAYTTFISWLNGRLKNGSNGWKYLN